MRNREYVDGGGEGEAVASQVAVEVYGHRSISAWTHAEVLYSVEYKEPEGMGTISRSVQRVGDVFWYVYEGDGTEHIPHASLADVLKQYEVDLFGLRHDDLAITCVFESVEELLARLFWADPGTPANEAPFRIVINGEPWRHHEGDAGRHWRRDDDPEAVREARAHVLKARLSRATAALERAERRRDKAWAASERAPDAAFDLRQFHTGAGDANDRFPDAEACRRVGAYALSKERSEATLVFRVTSDGGRAPCEVHRIGPFHWHWADGADAPDAFETFEALLDARGDAILSIGPVTVAIDAPGLPSPVVARLLTWAGQAPEQTRALAINGEAWHWRPDLRRLERTGTGPHTHDVMRRRAEQQLEVAYARYRKAYSAFQDVRQDMWAFEKEDR